VNNADIWKYTWNIVGWTGQAVFFSRVLVQWYVTEKKKQVVMPDAFWWLSIVGSLLLLLFAVFYDKHYVVIFSFAFSWIPYIRNLIINHRHREAHVDCPNCRRACPPDAKFCSECGAGLAKQSAGTPA
jgi:lipid-A-disaccharide synthase-like uncharacterized protein